MFHFPVRWRMPSVVSTAVLSAVFALPAVAAAPYKALAVSFPCQATHCDGELWLPVDAARPPVIVMAHGFGGLKDWGLKPYAERFVQAGFAVLRFDYRGFGKSGGLPRRVVDGRAHIQDWSSAIDALRARSDVDASRLGIWGTSYSGGQVLEVAAQRPEAVKAVSAQVPFVNGFQSSLTFPLKYQPQAAWSALRDLMRGDDETPLYVPVIAEGRFSALICPECVQGYKKLVPPGTPESENVVAARVFLSLPFFSPGRAASRIQAPTLIIAAEKDGLIPVKGVRSVAKDLRHGEYVELPGADHFSPYTGPLFEQVVTRQVDFFRKALAR